MHAAVWTPDDEERKGPVAEAAAAAASINHVAGLALFHAEQQRNAAPHTRFVGQRDEQGLPHGFGCELDAADRMVDGRCGVWSCGLLLQRRSVPLSLMPADCFINERDRGASLVRENGAWYRGGLDEQQRPHREGGWLNAAKQEIATGRYEHGRLACGSIKLANGGTYDGEFNGKGQRHGKGTHSASNGCVSAGTWHNDKFLSGKRTFAGRSEQGSFFDDKLHDTNCVIEEANGDRYEGIAWFGVFVEGMMTQRDGVTYKGQWSSSGFESGTRSSPGRIERGTWLNNQLSGSACVIEWPNGNRYEGDMRLGKKDGLGKIALKQPDTAYAGEWSDDRRAGFGVQMDCAGAITRCGVWQGDRLGTSRPVPVTHLPSDLFSEMRKKGAILLRAAGEWYSGLVDLDHQPHGKGTWRSADGRVKEEGVFVEGSLTEGSLAYPNGDTCDGAWKDGKPHGEGKFVRKSDGAISEGTWSEGKFVDGKCTFPGGEVQQGPFVDGKLNGDSCKSVALNGDRYDGAMLHGKKAGVGKLTIKLSGDTYEGEWKEDIRSGFGVQRNRYGIVACGSWAQNALSKSCPVPRASLPVGSLRHDDDALLFPDGRTYRGAVASDLPHGRGSMYRIDGSEELRGDWTAGVLTRGLLRFPNGDVYEGELADSKRKGLGVLWDKEGKVLKCGEWSNGWLWDLDLRRVPRRFIPFGDKLNDLNRAASLFYPSGEFFVGSLNAQDQPHGEGKMFSAHGLLKQQGFWSDGRFVGALQPVSAVGALPDAPGYVVIDVAAPSPRAAASPKAVAVDAPMDVDSGRQSAESQIQSVMPSANAMRPSRRRSALCIGNNNYALPLQPLTCCWTDVERMHNAMGQLKFDSSHMRTDLDYHSMSNEIDAFIASLKQQCYGPGDLALLYFSGHGCEVGTNNVYLLPTDIRGQDPSSGALSAQMIMRRFNRGLRGVQVAIIIESCRVSRCPTVHVNTQYERARRKQQQQAARFQRETHNLTKEAYAQWKRQQTQMPKPPQSLRRHDDYSSESELSSPLLSPSQSPSESESASSSSSLPAARPQASIPPHHDDLTRNHFAVVYACDTGHLALTGWNGGSVFSSCLVEQMRSEQADLSVASLVERTNKRMGEVLAARGRGEMQHAALQTSAAESITLTSERKP